MARRAATWHLKHSVARGMRPSRRLHEQTADSAFASLLRGLCFVAFNADRLQVRIVVRPTARLCDNVIDVGTSHDAAAAQARLAQTRVPLHDPCAQLIPGRAVPSLVAVTALPVRHPVRCFARVLLTVRFAAGDQRTAATVLAWAKRAHRHQVVE
jgi:hypothetical protein